MLNVMARKTAALQIPRMALATLMPTSQSRRCLHITGATRKTFEPDYLDSSIPPVPTYPLINIQLRGYNFDVLESFQSYVHRVAENMGVDVSEAWATPAKTNKVSTYIEGGTRVKNEIILNTFERNVQVSNLRSIDAPILLDIIRATLPEGVHLSMHQHAQEHYEERFIPDPFIDSIRAELAQGDEKLEAAKEAKEAVTAAKTAKKQAMLLKSLQSDEEE